MSSMNPITEFLNARERAAAHQVDTAPVALATADASPGVHRRGWCCCVASTRAASRSSPTTTAASRVISTAIRTRRSASTGSRSTNRSASKGSVERLSGGRVGPYFDGRPRGSQIGAWASRSESAPARARSARRAVSRVRTEIRWCDGGSSAILGWIPTDPSPHRILVRTSRPPPRSSGLHARRAGLEDRTPVPLIQRGALHLISHGDAETPR